MKNRINSWVNAKIDSGNFTDMAQFVLAVSSALFVLIMAITVLLMTFLPDGSPCPRGTREQLQVVDMQNDLPVYEVIGCIER